MIELWTEKYRPKTVDDYVFTDERQKKQVLSWVKDQTIPHILLSGSPGTGKTTLAKILVNELGIDDYDFLQINASRDNGVDFIKDTVEGFVQTMPFGRFKVVLMDEADYLSHNAQAIMRGLLETYASQARFIFTCNMSYKIMPAMHSRCQSLKIEKANQVDFFERAAHVLEAEKIKFDDVVLANYVSATYPDLRKCLNLLQANSTQGVLAEVGENDTGIQDWKLAAVDLLKKKKIREAREVLCNQASAEDMNEMFRWMYNNLDLWATTPEGQDAAILIIKKGLLSHTQIADPEINLSATLVELTQIEE